MWPTLIAFCPGVAVAGVQSQTGHRTVCRLSGSLVTAFHSSVTHWGRLKKDYPLNHKHDEIEFWIINHSIPHSWYTSKEWRKRELIIYLRKNKWHKYLITSVCILQPTALTSNAKIWVISQQLCTLYVNMTLQTCISTINFCVYVICHWRSLHSLNSVKNIIQWLMYTRVPAAVKHIMIIFMWVFTSIKVYTPHRTRWSLERFSFLSFFSVTWKDYHMQCKSKYICTWKDIRIVYVDGNFPCGLVS